jgi:hypothetical protein
VILSRTPSGGRRLTASTPFERVDVLWESEADGLDCAIVAPDGRKVGTARVDLRKQPEPLVGIDYPAPDEGCPHCGDGE